MSIAPFYPQLVFVNSSTPLGLMPHYLTRRSQRPFTTYHWSRILKPDGRTWGEEDQTAGTELTRGWARMYRQLIAMSSFSYGTRLVKNDSGMYTLL